MSVSKTIGILLQGKISEWTKDIVTEYQKNFPNSEILVSTWEDENTDDLTCNVIKSKPPPMIKNDVSTVNFQIVGCQEGLKNLKTDIILKSRTDQFIHNPKIFEIFENYCSPEKIMITDVGTYLDIEHRASDLCQIAYRQILLDYWNNIPLYTGFTHEEPGEYLTKYYVLKIKNDSNPWRSTLRKYFCVKSYHDDFQIEFEKLNNFENYKNVFDLAFDRRVSLDII